MAFVPRESEYSPTNMHTSPYYAGEYGGYFRLPNCTRYCYGRWWEIMGQQPSGLYRLGNGEDWWGNVSAYSKGQTPRLGAIICFADGPYSGKGHVAVLEKINTNGTYTFSNSAYQGTYWYPVTGSPTNNYGYHRAYRFQGFIYLPTEYMSPEAGRWGTGSDGNIYPRNDNYYGMKNFEAVLPNNSYRFSVHNISSSNNITCTVTLKRADNTVSRRFAYANSNPHTIVTLADETQFHVFYQSSSTINIDNNSYIQIEDLSIQPPEPTILKEPFWFYLKRKPF